MDAWEYAYLLGAQVTEWKVGGEWRRTVGQTAEQVIKARDVWVWSFRSAEGLEEWSVETDMIANRDPGTLAALNRARVTPLWLVLDFGETVGLDGSTLYDPTSETAVPAALSH